MKFINPGFLWALPLGLIPIIIYYLMRYRALKVAWGANYVLELALKRLKKKVRLDQLLLLALRVLACAALVVAFARPALKSAGAVVSGSGVNHVIVLDGSYSMLAGEQGARTWDRAVAAARSLTATWGRGETWSLLLMEDEPRWIVAASPLAAPEKAAETLAGLSPGEGASSLAKAFEAIRERFPAGQLEIYVFADDQAATWKGMENVGWPRARQAPVYWLNASPSDRHNLAVTAVRPMSDRAMVGHPHRVFVAVRNFSPETAKETRVELLVDGTFFARETVSLLPDQERWVHFDVSFDAPGAHYVSARMGPDALDFDNHMAAGLDATPRISVLVLRDREKSGKFDSAWEFLRIAGGVEATTREDGTRMFTKGPMLFSLCDGECADEALAGADVVLLDGGRTVTAQLASRLKNYVAHGGGLLLAADETVNKTAWNEMLGREGMLPAPLRALHVETLGGEQFQTLARSQFGDAALRPFETDEDGDLGNACFYSWHEFDAIPDDVTVLARFADQTPWALRKRFEPGCVILLASGLSGRGNNLVVREFYLPLVFRLFTDAAAGGIYPRTVRTGEPIRLRLAPENLPHAATFSTEGREAVPVTLEKTAAGPVATAPGELTRSGLCSMLLVREAGTDRVWFGVQGQRNDSDLTPMSAETKGKAQETLAFVEARTWEQLDETLKTGRRGTEWHHWVMVALLAILFAEMLLEKRFT